MLQPKIIHTAKKLHCHIKTHGFKYLAGLAVFSILTTAFVYRPSQTPTAKAAASYLWNTMLNPENATYEDSAKVVRTSSGNYFVAWEESVAYDSTDDIKMAKIDVDGNLIGSIITVTNSAANDENRVQLAPDNSDGVQIVFTTEADVYAAHYNSSGSLTCSNAIYRGNVNPGGGGNKEQVAMETIPQLLHDGNGGMYFSWILYDGNWRTYVTHLGSDCNMDSAWNPTVTNYGPFKVIEALNVDGSSFKMTSGGNNAMIWTGDDSASNYLITNKIDNTGAYVTGWTGTKYVYTGSSTSSAHTIASDGSGGLVVAHQDSAALMVHLTHLNSDGTADTNWGGTGTIDVLDTPSNSLNWARVINDGTNNFIVTWTRGEAGPIYHQYIQKVSGSDGQLLWGAGSPIEVISSDTNALASGSTDSIVPDTHGGAYLSYTTFMWGYRRIQNVKSDGSLDFGNMGYMDGRISNGWEPTLVVDGSGGVIAVRTEQSDAPDFDWDIFAERIESVPQIDYVSPNYSYIDANNVIITISGSSLADMTTATVGGEPCTLITKSSFSYECEVATMSHTAGLVDVYLEGPSGNTGSSGNNLFQIYGPPTVTGMSPNHGSPVGGTEITINGDGFGPETTVSFGPTLANISTSSSDRINLTSPEGTPGVVAVTLTNPGNQTVSAGDFTYDAYPREGAWSVNNILKDGYPDITQLSKQNPYIIKASDGNYIAAWTRYGSDMDQDIIVQKIDQTDGHSIWPDDGGGNGGMQITDLDATTYSQNIQTYSHPNLIADNSGGAYFIFREDHSSVGGGLDLMIQHVRADHSLQYGPNPLNLTNNLSGVENDTYNIISDGAGGVYVGGSNIDWNTEERHVFAMRVASDETVTPMQPSGGNFPIGSQSPALALDSSQNLYVVYKVIQPGTSTHTIEAQRFAPDGTKPGVGLDWHDTFNMPLVAGEEIYSHEIAVDSSNNIIVIYSSYVDPVSRVAAQKISSDGSSSSWFTPGVGGTALVASTTNPGSLQIVPDGADGAIAAWNEGNNGIIYAQKINTGGVTQWGADALQVSSGTRWDSLSIVNSITSDGAGGVILAYSSDQITLQKIDSSGALQWPEAAPGTSGYTSFSEYTNNMDQNPALVGDDLGGAVVVWMGRTMIGWDSYDNVYAQHYQIDNTPVPLSVDPALGSPAGGTNITISGIHFIDGGTTVTVGGLACQNIVVNSPRELTCDTQAHEAGTVDVSVTTINGTSTLTGGYEYGEPVIVPEGTIELHIADSVIGSNSDTGAGISNGDDAGGLADLDFTGAPATAPDTFSGAEIYTFNSGVPTMNPTALNIENLDGFDLTGADSIHLSNEDDLISTVVPLGFTTKIYGRDVDSVVVDSNGLAYLNTSADMSVNDSSCCNGYSMSNYTGVDWPASVDGSATGDIMIAAKWTDLLPQANPGSAITYSTDGVAPNRRFVITFADVPYLDPDTTQNTFQIKILESGPGSGVTVTNVLPASGTDAGGTPVLITGTGFTGATAVYFKTGVDPEPGTACINLLVINDTQIECETGAHGAALVNVKVVTPGGEGIGNGLYTYTGAAGGVPTDLWGSIKQVEGNGTNQYFAPFISKTNDNNYIIAYADSTLGTGNGEIVAEKINATTGADMWASPVQVSTNASMDMSKTIQMIPNASGGVFMAWQNVNGDILLQSIDGSDGALLWDAVNISESFNADSKPVMVSDNAGGVYLAFVRHFPEGRWGIDKTEVTRVNAEGTVHSDWNTGGIGNYRLFLVDHGIGSLRTIKTNSDNDLFVLTAQGSIAYVDKLVSTGQTDPDFPSVSTSLMGDSDGEISDIIVNTSGGVTLFYESQMFIGWPTYHVSAISYNDTGNINWAHYSVTANSYDNRAEDDIADLHVLDMGAQQLIAYEFSNDNKIYAQKIDATTGEPIWAAPVSVTDSTDDSNASFYSLWGNVKLDAMIKDTGSGAFFVYTSQGADFFYRVHLQHIDTNGLKIFGSNGYELESLPGHSDDNAPAIAGNSLNAGVIAWMGYDSDLSNATSIYTFGFDSTQSGGGGVCGAGPGETCGEIIIGCNLAGTISISNITPEATFEPRYTNFYQDATNAPLESNIQVDITDTRGYGSCGNPSTLSIQSSGLALGASTLGLSLGTALTQGNITCPDDNCVPDSAHLSDVATTPGATGSIATGADVLNLSEGFDGTIRLQISGDNLEVVKPLEPISKGDYVGDITFTLI